MASVDKRPNGTWRVRWRETPGGPQKTKAFRNGNDAKAWRAKVEHEINTGSYVDPRLGRVSFSERADRWLRNHNGRPATVVAQRNALLPAREQFGDRPIAAIRRSDIQNMVEAMKAKGRKANTIRLTVQVVGTVFREAVVDDLIAKSPVVKIDTPRPEKKMVVPTREQILSVLAAAEEWFRPGIILGAGLGLRQAEAAALTWDRVSFLDRTVKVDRQWARGGGFAATKTDAGNRTVPMPAWAQTELSRYSPGAGATGPVVSLPADRQRRGDGHASQTAWTEAWLRACRKAEVEGIVFHDLRHFFATALIAGGASVKQVQSAGGWASAAIVLDTYAGYWPSDEDTTRAAFDRAWEGVKAAEDSLRTGTAE